MTTRVDLKLTNPDPDEVEIARQVTAQTGLNHKWGVPDEEGLTYVIASTLAEAAALEDAIPKVDGIKLIGSEEI